MLAADIAKRIEAEHPDQPNRQKVWLKVSVVADSILEALSAGWAGGNVLQAIDDQAERLRRDWDTRAQRFRGEGEGDLLSLEVIDALAGDYLTDRRLRGWLPAKIRRDELGSVLAYALLAVALEQELKERGRKEGGG